MEISTIIGLGGAVAAVIVTLLIEGGNLTSLVNISALTLIAGGTVAIGLTQYGLKEVLSIPKYVTRTIFPPTVNYKDLISTLVSFAEKSRREGLLSLEDTIGEIEDEMLHLGLQLVIDGTDPELVRSVLSDLSESIEEHEKVGPEIFESLGGYSPTLGIIGTVMGLVHVLESLGGAGGIEQLGKGIAVAFIATFYGIGFANLFWAPLSNKMKLINHKIFVKNNIITEGVLGIQAGLNPRIILQKLLCCIKEPEIRESLKKQLETE
jgi:chemotaxis protein MotA